MHTCRPLEHPSASLCSVVEYATYDDMKNALRKLDGAELNGRRIRLTKEKDRDSRHSGSRRGRR